MKAKIAIVAAALLVSASGVWAVPIDTFDGTIDSWGLTFSGAGPGTPGTLSFAGSEVDIDTDGDTFAETYRAVISSFDIDTSSAVMISPGVWQFTFVDPDGSDPEPILVDGLRIYDGVLLPEPIPPQGDYASFDIVLRTFTVVGQTSGTINFNFEVDLIFNGYYENDLAPGTFEVIDLDPFVQGGGGDIVMTLNITGQGLPGLLDALLNPGPGNNIPLINSGTSGSFSVSTANVPEPTTMALLAAGLAAAAIRRRK